MVDDVFDDAPQERKVDFLAQLPLFSGLSAPMLAALNGITYEYAFGPRKIIAHEGDVANHLYIVRAGQLEAWRLDEARQYLKEGVYSAGDFFRDEWLFEGSLHPTTVRSRRSGRLLMIEREAFLNFLKGHTSAVAAIFPHLSLEAQDAILHSRFRAYLGRQTAVRPLRPINNEAELAADENVTNTGLTTEQIEAGERWLKRYAKLQLLPEEVVYFNARRSAKTLGARAVAMGLLAFLLFVVPIILLGTSGVRGQVMVITGAVLASVPLLELAVYYINWLNCYFIVTNKRIIRYESKPLRFKTNVEKIELSNVQSVNTMMPSFVTNLLNIGTAAITTAAQDSVIYFDFIDQPKQVEEAINKINELNAQRNQSAHRARLRRSVDELFEVAPALERVRPPAPPPPPATFRQRWRERFVRAESASEIMYHKHPIALLRAWLLPALVGLVLFLVGLVLYFFLPEVLGIPAVAGLFFILGLVWLGLMLWLFEDWRNDTYLVTNRYIVDIDRAPFGLRESRKQAELSKIENVRAEQEGFLPSVFNFGQVHIETAGADSNIIFENVREPERIQNEIFAKRDLFRKKMSVADEEQRRRDFTMMIDMYYQGVQQGRIPGHRPLPEVEGEEDDPYQDYGDEIRFVDV